MNKYSILLIACGIFLGSCCNEDFIMPDYDLFEFAIDMTDEIDTGCSGAIYSTVGATSDGDVGSCNPNPSSLHNRWFKFMASNTSIYIYVNNGNDPGTQLHTYMTLWEADGVTELACAAPYFDDPVVYLGYGPLTVGEWYYLSIDVEDSQSAGTFSLCLATD